MNNELLMESWRKYVKTITEDAISGAGNVLGAAEMGYNLATTLINIPEKLTELQTAIKNKLIEAKTNPKVAADFADKLAGAIRDKASTMKNVKLADIPTIISDLNGVIQLAGQIAAETGTTTSNIFGSYLEATASGTVAGAAMSVLAVALITHKMTGFLIDMGREFKKSKGPYAIKAVREFEQENQPLGFEEAKRRCSSSRCQNDLYMKIRDAGEFDPYLKTHFPFAYQLIMSTNWAKSVQNLYLR